MCFCVSVYFFHVLSFSRGIDLLEKLQMDSGIILWWEAVNESLLVLGFFVPFALFKLKCTPGTCFFFFYQSTRSALQVLIILFIFH